jgi:ABC-type Fe3+-citrate transport system substrate-binding protein
LKKKRESKSKKARHETTFNDSINQIKAHSVDLSMFFFSFSPLFSLISPSSFVWQLWREVGEERRLKKEDCRAV